MTLAHPKEEGIQKTARRYQTLERDVTNNTNLSVTLRRTQSSNYNLSNYTLIQILEAPASPDPNWVCIVFTRN